MTRYLLAAVAVVVFGSVARAGGPPPVYVVVTKVVLEPSASAPERIRIEGSFVRLESRTDYTYGKPVEGFVYLDIATGKEAECRAEWAKWESAAGTGKAVAVGSCGDGGCFLKATIHKPGEKVEKPDAAYTTELLGRFCGKLYADGDVVKESPVKELLTFAKKAERR